MALTPATGLADYASGISTAALQVNSDTGQVSIGTDSPTTARLRVGTAITMSVGVITATDAVFRGNVSIAGTLTYEDVTSIDSVGVLTARSGVRIPAGGLTVAGVSSFSSALDVNAELDVDGQTDLDNLIVAGVSTFSSSIDLNGELDVDGQTDLDTLQVAGVSTFAANVSIADKIIHTGDTNTAIRFPAVDTVTVETGGSERVRVNSSGFVGVNTDIPGSPLEVNGGSGLDVATFNSHHADGPLINIQRSGTVIGFVGSGKNLHSTTGSADGLALRSQAEFTIAAGGATERLRVSAGGQLLINTKTSRSFSDNSGNGPTPAIQIEATNSSAIMSIVAASTADSHRAGTINLGRHRNTTVGETPTVVNNGDTLGAVCFSGGDGSDMLSVAAHIRGLVDGEPGDNDMPGALSFSTTPDGSSSPYNQERMRITSAGKVGIGTNNPNEMLDITNSGTGSQIQLRDSSTGGAAGDGFRVGYNGSGAQCWNFEPTYFRIATSNTERVRVTSSGNVLVGTAVTPVGTDAQYAKFAVRGNTINTNAAYLSLGNGKSTADTGNDDNLGIIVFNDNDSSDAGEYARIIGATDGANGTDDYPGKLAFYTTSDGDPSPTERLRITSAGLVGIGTITPSVVDGNGLHIAGSSAGLKLQNTNNGDWAYIEYADESNTTKFIQGYRDQSGLYAIRPGTSLNATPGISLTSAGKVGINITDNTTADLQVRTGTNANGILRMGGNSGSAIGLDITYSNSSFTSTIFKQNYRSTSAGALMEFDSGYFVFKTGTAGAEKLRITSDGKVGIGTNAPNHPLHIHSSGTSYAQFTDEATGIGATDGVIIGIDHPHTYVWNYEDGDFVVAAGAAEKFRVGYGGTTIQNQRYSTYTNNSSVAGGQTRTLTITALRYGTACIHFGGTDGNGQYVHFKINLGGQMWGSGNGYNAEVSSSGYVGGSYSVTKNNTSYVIQVTAGSNIMYYSYTFESTSYSASGYAAIAET